MKLNPFAGLPNPKEVWAWGMFDLANQSFTLLIITLLFSMYVSRVVVPQPIFDEPTEQQLEAITAGEAQLEDAPPDVQDAYAKSQAAEARGKLVWSLIHGSSMFVVVAVSPVIGAWGDVRARRKLLLMITGVISGTLTCALGLIGPGMIILAATLYIPANICYQVGENFLASFLPDVSSRRTMGRVSATGWTMGYVGALLLLVIVFGVMLAAGLKEPQSWRPFFVLAGAWFLLGIIPAGLLLRADERPLTHAMDPWAEAIRRVRRSLAGAGEFGELRRFLVAFLVYAFGVQTIIGFASIIARDFGFTDVDLVLFVGQITITAGIAAIATSTFQDRVGAKTTVIIYLLVWVFSCLAMVLISLLWPHGGPKWPLWVVGNGLGFALGGIGTASRSMVGRLTPRHRTAEFFGLWGMVYKLAGGIGIVSFGLVARFLGDAWSLLLLTGFFASGLLLVLRVGETRGIRQARRSERTFALTLGRQPVAEG